MKTSAKKGKKSKTSSSMRVEKIKYDFVWTDIKKKPVLKVTLIGPRKKKMEIALDPKAASEFGKMLIDSPMMEHILLPLDKDDVMYA